MNVAVVYLAGGIGVRAQQGTAKQLAMLAGKPLMIHALEKMESVEEIDPIVIPCAKDVLEETETLLANWGYSPENHIVIPGGETRQESVYVGLKYLEEKFPGIERVIIHEAARPFVTVQDFRRLIDCGHPNAILGAAIPFTVLKRNAETNTVSGVLNRSDLVNVQLPHIFSFAELLEAHEKARAEGNFYTEDASLLFAESAGEVEVLEGNELNLKLTYPSDYVIGESLYRNYVLRGGADA